MIYRQHQHRILLNCCLLAAMTGLVACVSVKTEHKVEPIHITMDVNVRLERELDAAFSELDAQAQTIAKNKRPEGGQP